MRADLSAMIAVPIARLSPTEPVPFPLFLYLPRNQRMVPICPEGEAPEARLLESARARGIEELWTLPGFGPAVERLSTGEPVAIPRSTDVAEAPAAELAALNESATEALRQLFTESSASPEARSRAAESANALADALLARRRDPFFESVRALRSLQPAHHHSVVVGSLAAALNALRNGDPDLGAELAAAGTLHDIGLSLLPRNHPASGAEYESHVEAGAALLETCTDPVPETVIELVREHHERQDREGFPSGLHASKLREGSELLIMADTFDDLCTGVETGTCLSPREAFAWLREHRPAGRGALTALEEPGA